MTCDCHGGGLAGARRRRLGLAVTVTAYCPTSVTDISNPNAPKVVAVNWIKHDLCVAWYNIQKGAGTVASWALDLWHSLADELAKLWSALGDLGQKIWAWIQDLGNRVKSFLNWLDGQLGKAEGWLDRRRGPFALCAGAGHQRSGLKC